MLRALSKTVPVEIVAIVAATLTLTACTANPAGPANASAFQQTDIKAGTGAAAASGSTITVNYTGWLYDASKTDGKGAQFDTNGTTPFSLVLGTGAVIQGWDQGIVGMQVGGIRRLIIPPSLAYGDIRHGVIPANATIVFDIELLTLTS
jgi:FKBP-type peptidyl-prolyl cis-trans isomerase FkpA